MTAPEGLLDALHAYESALMADDVAALDAFFLDAPDTLRADAAGLLIGHDAIAAFRRGRGGAPQRTLISSEVRVIDPDNALIVSVLAPLSGGRGLQTQLWTRVEGRWLVRAAQVSAPVPAIQSATWRVVGSPLVAGAASGPLVGQTVAVKDLYDVAGFAVGVGNPTWLAEASPAQSHAPAVAALVDAGAALQGIAQTDEFAYSIAGKNAHYGTPPNPAVPGGLPGGSSSGPAAAVAQGQATIGLGTDTAGSIRVPASYQGLWGLRTTHGTVPLTQVVPLAPTFDTVGWLTRDAATLRLAARASLPAPPSSPAPSVEPTPSVEPVETRTSTPSVEPTPSVELLPSVEPVETRTFVSALALTSVADPSVVSVFGAFIAGLSIDDLDLGDPDELFEAFRVVQATDAWRSDGAWVTAHPGAVGPGVAERFVIASEVTAAQEARGREAMGAHRARLDALLGDRILLLPSASSAAPSTTADAATLDAVRAATLRLCCIAGLTGRPALSVPLLEVPGPFGQPAPLGVCLIGPRGSDLALIDAAERLLAR